MPVPVRAVAALTGVALLALSGCSLGTKSADDSSTPGTTTLVVATHDSWAMSKKVMADFTKKTGIVVRIQQQGDAGELTNKLVLTKDSPIADVAYGVDNTFATRAIAAGVFEDYTPPAQPASADRFDVPGSRALSPVDYSDVCVNADDTWFARHHLAEPRTFADLVKPAYKNLLVTPGASTSSTGLAFLIGTIGAEGSGWQAYWKKLVANGAEVVSGWEDAYEVDFTAGSGHGSRPLVVSYSSSPPDTIPKGATTPTTSALLDTCFRQVEYAGVVTGTQHAAAAHAFIDYMQGRAFQAALPENMYVYPVNSAVALPPEWARFAPPATRPVQVSAAEITAKRDTWLSQWRDIVTG